MKGQTQTKVYKEYSPFYPEKPYPVAKNQFALPTLWIVGFLIVCFFILKSFIYITDEKRKNK